MTVLMEYIRQNYLTLMLLIALIVIRFSTRRIKTQGLNYIGLITGLVFAVTVLEYLEEWCITYEKPVWIMYIKSAFTYNIYPLLLVLELMLVTPIKNKVLLLIPYFINASLVISDLFGMHYIYGYSNEHAFQSGNLHFVPVIVLLFYILLLLKSSLTFLRKEERIKGLIILFMSLSTIMTTFLEYSNIVTSHTAEIAALDILVYYFYLTAIHHNSVQEQYHKTELSLERQKVRLLMAQIQPHFIYNSLMALQAKSIDNPELYHGIESFGKYLRANFEVMTEDILVPFRDELKNIRAYVDLEHMNYGNKLVIKYDIEMEDFMLPALTVEPLVENAIRYGVGTYEQGGKVEIIVRDEWDYIEIEVKDDGSGGNKLTDAQKKRKGIGIENVKLRLNALNMGSLHISQDESGTSAVIHLKWRETPYENTDD